MCWVSPLAVVVWVCGCLNGAVFELIPLLGGGGRCSSGTVGDQAEPQSSTLWRLSESA
jgi:hypothetical protein